MLWISAAIEALEKAGARAPADPQETERLRAF